MDSRAGYYPIPATPSYDYEPNRPYMVEKPPSLEVVSSGGYVPPTLKPPSPPSFIGDSAPSARYLPSFPVLQPESQPDMGQPGSRELLSYNTQPPVGDFYIDEPHLTPHLPVSANVPRSQPAMEEHAMSARRCSPHFGDALPHHHPDNGPDGNAPRFASIPGQGHVAGYQDMIHGGPSFDVMLSNPLNRTAARRGPFKNIEDREKTAHTRKIGSCVRCRMQRIRVWPPSVGR